MGTALVLGGLTVAGVLGCVVVNLPLVSDWISEAIRP